MKLMVVSKGEFIPFFRKALGDDWMVLTPGSAVMGWRFSVVMLSPYWHGGEMKHSHAWLEHLLGCRIEKDAQIIYLNDF